MSSDYELLKVLYDAVSAGADGVAFGRNIFQHPNPAPLSCAIRHILDNSIDAQDLEDLAEACNLITEDDILDMD